MYAVLLRFTVCRRIAAAACCCYFYAYESAAAVVYICCTVAAAATTRRVVYSVDAVPTGTKNGSGCVYLDVRRSFCAFNHVFFGPLGSTS